MKTIHPWGPKLSNVRSRIVEIINDVCHPEKPNLSDPSGPLVGRDLDSLDFASLLMAVEDEYGITIDEDSIEHVGTLDRLVEFVEKSR